MMWSLVTNSCRELVAHWVFYVCIWIQQSSMDCPYSVWAWNMHILHTDFMYTRTHTHMYTLKHMLTQHAYTKYIHAVNLPTCVWAKVCSSLIRRSSSNSVCIRAGMGQNRLWDVSFTLHHKLLIFSKTIHGDNHQGQQHFPTWPTIKNPAHIFHIELTTERH